MKEFQSFYKTQAWKKTAEAYARSQNFLCELCRKQGLFNPGEIVHHKIHLTEETVNNPKIALDWSNLQLVCRKHHAQLHSGKQRRYIIDEFGRVTPSE